MKRARSLLFLLFIFSLPVHAQKSADTHLDTRKEEAAREARDSSAVAPAKLPIRRVVLYKNGIGYFEHLGHVRGSQSVHIDFTSAQLNDVLKSFTVLDLSGGRITGVEYNSEAPLARRLATLRLALGERPTTAEFFGALRGARLEVRSGTAPQLTGRLLSVERKTRTGAGPGWTVETDEISLITDGGEVRSVDLNAATSVRIIDKDLQVEVGRYLGLIASSRDQDVRRMEISTTGTGERSLYVSYISEVPIWKTTYRIVLPSEPSKKPLLQGWAIIDNTVGEDWDGVELSLVAGAPHSFIQQLSEPFYGRRPEVPLPESVQLSPQTHAAMFSGGNGRLTGTVTDPAGAAVAGVNVRLLDENNAVIAQTVTENSGLYNFLGAPTGKYRLELQHPGFQKHVVSALNLSPGDNLFNTQLQIGSSTQTVEVNAEPAVVNSSTSEILSRNVNSLKLSDVANRPRLNSPPGSMGGVFSGSTAGMGAAAAPPPPFAGSNLIGAARSMGVAAASGTDLGDLFEYKLKDLVTLKKNQSGLVPVIQTDIQAEKVSIWSGTASGHPLRGLWLKNTSPLTLDGGSFSVLESEVFAGEGLTDPIKPDDRRLISYATDLGLLVDVAKNSQPQHVSLVKISKGILTEQSLLHERTLYTVRNQGAARTLVIEHPARPDWSLARGHTEPDEKASSLYRYRVEVPAKATASLPVEEVRTLSTSYQLSDLTDLQIALFVQRGELPPPMAEALGKITALKADIAKLESEMEDRQKDIDRIVEDQGRLRENMKALRGTSEEKALLLRYTRQLDEQETRLEALRKTIQSTEAQRDKLNAQLEDMIAGLQLEATL